MCILFEKMTGLNNLVQIVSKCNTCYCRVSWFSITLFNSSCFCRFKFKIGVLFNLPDFFQDGVILGADTRATEGPIVADKNCEKIHYMAPNIYCCGAGTAADTEAVTGNW